MSFEIPEELLKSAENASKLLQDLKNAERQTILWNTQLESLKKSHEAAMKAHNFLISRWNIADNKMEELRTLDDKD